MLGFRCFVAREEVAALTGASGYLRNPRAQRRRPQDDRGQRIVPLVVV
jgi:hypothetical protein